MSFNIIEGNVKIRGKDGTFSQIGTDGRLNISGALPEVDGFTKIEKLLYESIEGYNFKLSDPYIIPNGKKLFISSIYGSGDDGSHSCGIFSTDTGIWDDNVERITGFHFTNGISKLDCNYEIIGDGVKSIIIRLTRRDKGKMLLGAGWIGYIEV